MEEHGVSTNVEQKLDTLIQLLASLLNRCGGETVLNLDEFEAMQGLSVFAEPLPSNQIRLYLVDEERDYDDIDDLDCC